VSCKGFVYSGIMGRVRLEIYFFVAIELAN